MTTLTPERFAKFFSELHKTEAFTPEPFPWQKRLAAKVLAGEWPQTVKLPTASGKTALIDVWVYALAAQAALPACQRTTPRRMAFVVDRRVIVDEAHKRAEKIARRLAEAKNGILKEVADALLSLAGPDSTVPLQCFQLRGGMYRDDDWARTPTQPTLITSTVDQIGSRLLFRSYGFVSGFTYPIHAGLAAFDMLIVLDEAHCSQPFYQTASAIARYRKCAETPLPGPFHFVTMTATPPEEAGEPFELDDEDRNHPILSRRLNASKPTLLLAPVGNAEDDKSKLREALVSAMVEQAERLANNGLKAIGIMVNRVATAKAVHAALAAKGHKSLLLIGRMRPFDRDLVQRGADFELLLADKSETRQLEAPVFVVATQTLEVGANLDFDGLVSECASLDALRQRFGRLNRMGRKIPAEAEGVLVIQASQAKDSKDDPVYGAALAETWKWLNTLSAGEKPAKGKGGKKSKAAKGDKRVDLGIAALQPHLDALDKDKKEDRNSLLQDSLNAPVMLPAHIDAWAQTSPMPLPTPDVSIFLHGPQRGQAEVQLVWRADLPELSEQNEDPCIDTVALCPPTSVEALQAPLYLVKRWLRQKDRAADDSLADVESARLIEDRDSNKHGRYVLIWRGPKNKKRGRERLGGQGERMESRVTNNPDDILPGDTVVIPAEYGGWDLFGHLLNPERPDIAEAARFQARRHLVFRLHPKLLAYLPDGSARSALLEAANAEDKPDLEEVKTAFEELAQSGPEHLRELFKALAGAQLKAEEYPARDEQAAPGWVITGRLPSPPTKAGNEPTLAEEDDELSLNGFVTLKQHVDGVTNLAVQFAKQCGLPDELVEDFRLAGQFHDAGKADPRFQDWLYGCMNARYVRGRSKLIAKAKARTEARKWEAKAESGYPDGARHELLSVSLIQNNEHLKAQAHDWDLVLHLIASHHGRCRPFAPVVDDPKPETVEVELYGHTLRGATRTGLEQLDSGVAERFWKLTRKYGWWGLAYLETIFRLADHRQSQKDMGK
ncbi:MAG: CRISPR-associated endonuclease Cas3'' [Candidatus Thermofonsia Clade 3 bacterium]|jgi:CRISPR-associated endonuclease/helicase Cas3|uniref:CRISPR-associated endonuclease Cas3 n=1 Tax=Candidatus Thermofonsia Clade 3 bacterium TaxID=2364212 RepID=A0A2M8QAB0_9CHLR|nr:type I-U CRISPR-associated helicase/endonuclease Cas3 [Candidatus Roseilinea sp. NK_OTU-006]PJF46704.1 MAG: CRISPR-associated endonuclease Cas3'' [Candidatus Thermofonsia Clade 3 bacterium]